MLEKKKILYIITKGNFGGAQRYVYDLTTNLPRDQFEAIVVCGQGGLLIEKLRDSNIRTIEIESLQRDIDLKSEFKVFKKLLKIIKVEKPDIIHLNSSKIGGLGALAGRLKKVPKIIFTSHGWAFNEERSALQKIAIYFLHWLTIILCHKVIAVSEKSKKDVAFLPFISHKIEVVYNGIKALPPKEKMKSEEARAFLADTESQKTVIYSISELHRNKGLDVALRALNILPKEIQEQIIYCIAGSGKEKEKLEKLAEELDLKNMLIFKGFVPEARKFLPGADIFLLSSRTENFPYVILESGLAGLPIISTSVGGVPEIIKDMQNGILVHPRNPKEIAEAIKYLLEHKKLMRELGREIKSTVINFFSLKKMMDETIRLYQ
ncbi:MAG: glycosyltransferase [Candidatus Zambryskibacteria bacterium]|nr:glycosyltransferase [Candidatus Zambryskibacteria bacterium]